jgi:3-oxoacyl-[acyl-carrier protein] reductase
MGKDAEKVATITGGTRGIGAAIAVLLAQRGVRLVLNGRGRDPEVDQTILELKNCPTLS